MNKTPSPKHSLLERAAEIYDFSSALRGKGLPRPEVRAEDIPVAPPPFAPPPEVAAVSVEAALAEAAARPVMPPVAANADSVAAAITVPAPKPRAADWSGAVQKLDREAMAELGYLVPNSPVSGLSEEFRIVKRELLTAMRGGNGQEACPNGNVILIASAHSGEGKTFCAVNLGVSLSAEPGLEVLLVDGDIAKPSIVQNLGLKGDKGLMDALVDPSARIEDYLIPTDVPSLFVLPAGQSTEHDAEYLGSARMADLLDALVAGRPDRVVIFDSQPLLTATPAASLASHVGQTVFVVRADRTSEAALRDAAGLLRGCGQVRPLLNGVKFSASGRRFGSDYGKGG